MSSKSHLDIARIYCEMYNNIIDQIKGMLVEEHGEESWEDFVDNQEIGNCQFISSSIAQDFLNVKRVFGEIEVDEPYIDEHGDEQNLVTHHWVEIDGRYYDFSKGTLKDYIEWDDMYNPFVDDLSRYHPIST
jgi:hypothetical protein